MKKNIILLAILIILIFSILSGCVNNSNNNDNNNISDTEAQRKIIGLWQRTNFSTYQTWNFLSNGTVIVSDASFTMIYWFENGSLYTYISNIDYFDQYKYKFGNDFKSLTLGLISNDIIIDPDTGERIDPGSIVFEITFNKLN